MEKRGALSGLKGRRDWTVDAALGPWTAIMAVSRVRSTMPALGKSESLSVKVWTITSRLEALHTMKMRWSGSR